MISRRKLMTTIGATGAAGMIAPLARAAPTERRFPEGFVWGCATAAYQIEGAAKEDGRGPSIWDIFSHTPGKVINGDTGDIACDSYHRYPEDTRLLKDLGARAYRFSLSWSRIFPSGRGKPNPKGVDHYKRVVDNLLENGIEPYVTLFHWDLPAALPGGWQSRDTAKAFADYAGYMTRQLGDRVKTFMTTNELRTFVDLGHQEGTHAPGLQLAEGPLKQVRHHALLAHGLAVQAMRAEGPRDIRIGLAENPVATVPVIETPAQIEAARKAFHAINGGYLTAVMEGAYPDAYMATSAPQVEARDMAAIASPLDFLAINIYQPTYVLPAEGEPGFTVVPPPVSFPRMVLPWLTVGPEAMYWGVRHIADLWKPKEIYITENGCAAADARIEDRVDDTDRVMFLRNYIGQLQRAVADGYPVKGYFLWSLLDNFEWAEGYSKRFGIHYTDFRTQRRIPKLSAAWYREVIRRNAVL